MSLLLTFEGTDGSGKGTQVELLARRLADHEPVVVREPGGTALGERIRELVLHEGGIAPLAEMHLFLAARAQLVEEVIRPALAAGRVVIADRYHDSTRAYQGGARGLEVGWPIQFPQPDRTFLLELPAAVGLDRRGTAGGGNRMEAEAAAFHESVAEAYARLAAAEPDRWVRLDALLAPDEVHRAVWAEVEPLLGRQGVPGSS